VHILLTNDDGITSRGLFEAKLALERHGTVAVIAPDSNRSGSARSITIHRSLTVTEVELRDGSTGYATDGTPVDCVRFGDLGLVGERPGLIVSGINYGYNLGDDVTYSGTVAAAFEGILLGIPGIAISQGAPTASGSDFRHHESYDFGPSAAFLGELVGRVIELGLPPATVLNVNVPSRPAGVAAGRLGRRIYTDRLDLESDQAGHRRYRIYGDEPSYHDESGTDFRAIAEGKIAITPIHLDLTSRPGLDALERMLSGLTSPDP
jgi:5'-nucleotidase